MIHLLLKWGEQVTLSAYVRLDVAVRRTVRKVIRAATSASNDYWIFQRLVGAGLPGGFGLKGASRSVGLSALCATIRILSCHRQLPPISKTLA